MNYRDKDGREISAGEHMRLRMDEGYSRIGLAVSSDGHTEVSTVWLGNVYALFQTMVFNEDGSGYWVDSFDLAKAESDHAAAVQQFIIDAGERVL